MVVAKLFEAGVEEERHMGLLEEGGLRVPLRITTMDGEEVLWEDDGSDIFHPYNPLIGEEDLCVDPVVFRAKGEGKALSFPGKQAGPQLADEWTPDRLGQKYIPRVIIWDEICTVPRPVLETFLDWLNQRGVQVICCGDQGQPPPISG